MSMKVARKFVYHVNVSVVVKERQKVVMCARRQNEELKYK